MIRILSTPEEAVKIFAEELKQLIDATLKKKKNFYLALSGGSTPQLLFKVLKKKYLKEIDWSSVHFFWGDERCVEPDDLESNYGTANKLFLKYADIPKENIHRIQGEQNPKIEARRYSGEILMNVPTKNNLPKFDIIILGMGADGHTASIFPNQMKLFNSENYCEVTAHPITKQKRITITGKVINNAENICILATGSEKSNVISEIINKNNKYEKYPASHIAPTWGEIKWYLDKAAGSLT